MRLKRGRNWGGRDPTHWKKGRSVYSLADFFINLDGADCLQSVVNLVFKTRSYDKENGKKNFHDYEKFVDCVGGKSLPN